MELIYISALLVALAFAYLTFFIVKTLMGVSSTIQSLDHTVSELETKMKEISHESEQLVHKTNSLTDDIQHKVESTDGMFDSLHNVGESLNNINDALSRGAAHFSMQSSKQTDQLTHIIRWSDAAMNLYSTYSKNKSASAR